MKKLLISLLLVCQVFNMFADTPEELYKKGLYNFTQKNYSVAIDYLEQAKNYGYADAYFILGIAYASGHGVKKNSEKAHSYYKQGAELGSLGCMSMASLSSDEKESFNYSMMAAYLGANWGQYRVGYCYENGKAVNKDLHKAAMWYRLSAINGLDTGGKAYSRLEKKGYSVTIAEANAFMKEQNIATKSSNSTSNTFIAEATILSNYSPSQPSATSPAASTAPSYTVSPSSVSSPKPAVSPTPSASPLKKSDIDSSIPESRTVADKTFALIIANENYSSVSKVDYARNDGMVFSQYCQKTLGIPEKHIILKQDATFGAIEGAITRLEQIGDAYDGDLDIIVYYAGHGIPDEKTRDSFIIPVDGDGSMISTCIRTSSIYKRLARINANSVVVFMDACFCGSVRGDGMLASARGVRLTPNEDQINGKMVVFTAAQGDETAYPLLEQGHGLFTYYLLKKIQSTSGNICLGDIMDYVISSVKKASIVNCGRIQTPAILTSSNATNWREWTLKGN